MRRESRAIGRDVPAPGCRVVKSVNCSNNGAFTYTASPNKRGLLDFLTKDLVIVIVVVIDPLDP